MINYRFALKKGRKTIPVAVFENDAYALAGEFLLAERGLLSRFSELLHGEEDGALSGNVFTLTKRGDACILLNNMTEHTLEMPTGDLRKLTDSYRNEVKRLRTESRK